MPLQDNTQPMTPERRAEIDRLVALLSRDTVFSFKPVVSAFNDLLSEVDRLEASLASDRKLLAKLEQKHGSRLRLLEDTYGL